MKEEKIYEGEKIYDDTMLQYCYEMGYFSKIEEPNLKNCSFELFSSQERRDAWHNGKKRALKELKAEYDKKMKHIKKLLKEADNPRKSDVYTKSGGKQ